MVTVSVVIPTYNRADVLPRAVDSVLEQTYENFEVIVVDDGSTDNTEDVVKSYADNRVCYISFDSNKGANAARNEGIKQGNGEYISFLDSDDEFTKNHIKKVLSVLSDTDPSIKGAYTTQITVQNHKERFLSSASQVLSDPAQVIEEYLANGFSSFTFHQDVFDQVGLLDENLKAFQDMEFLIRYLDHYNLLPIPDPLVMYHTQEDRISSDPSRKLSALEYLVTKHKEKIKSSNDAFLHYSRGHLYAKDRNISAARRHFFTASKGNIKSLKYHLHTISILFGYGGYKFTQYLKRKIKLHM